MSFKSRATRTSTNVITVDWRERAARISSGSSYADRIAKIETIEKNEQGTLMACVLLTNGNYEMIPTERLHDLAPKKLFAFYESHMRFISQHEQSYDVEGSIVAETRNTNA
ncbi:hypothetical protein, partial [Bradyrhizobium sp.]|uniref:hypothetical protein n=1 Tax=Bradyrhizobium sp. TaxID=376 RepID=UPI002617EC04